MRVLFLTHRLPYAPNRGDRIRAFYLLQEVSRFAKVSLFSLIHDDDEASHVSSVPFAEDVTGVRVSTVRNFLRSPMGFATGRPLTHVLLDAGGANAALNSLLARKPPDVVLAYCSSMVRFALEPPLDRLPCVLDMVDVDSAKWQEMATLGRAPLRWIYRREAKTLRVFEAEAVRRVASTLVVNDRERSQMLQIAPEARIRVVGNGIDVDGFRPSGPPASDPVVIFCGVLNYHPNEEGVHWFVEAVWPIVLKMRPDARFVIVGSGATARIRRLAESLPSVQLVGRVAEVQSSLWSAAVSVAPLRLARGLQNKVLEALAAGLPVVATPAVLDGIPPTAQPGCVSGDTAETFAEAVISLLKLSPEARRTKALSAQLDRLSWRDQLQPLEGILTGALRPQEG